MPKRHPVLYRTAFATYERGDPLGSGGSGVVYEVRDEDGQQFALKILHANVDRRKLKRFKNEISFCQKSNHANIIRIVDHGVVESEEGSMPFYVTPMFPATLRKLIEKGIEPGDVLPLFDQILSGVEAAHLMGVVHRDIKPENILFDAASRCLVLADFGIASFQEENLYTAVETKDNERLANFQYAAPEQGERGREVNLRADIFALGYVLNEMFTGIVPRGTNPKRASDVSATHAYLDAIIDKMCRQEPDDRPESISHIKRELQARSNEFIALQKLNQEKTEVIPESQVDDPLIREPIEIVGFDYQTGVLSLTLSQKPNPTWIEAYQGQPPSEFLSGADAARWIFKAKSMEVPRGPNPNEIQMIVEFAKRYVRNANQIYKNHVEAMTLHDQNQRRLQKRKSISEEEARLRVLREVRL